MSTALVNECDVIRSKDCPACKLCGSLGQFIYESEPDRLFGAAGVWSLKQCSNTDCGLIWLDPMPLPEEIGKAYKNYYTHAAQDSSKRLGLLRTLDVMMHRGYLASRYGYGNHSNSLERFLGYLLYLRPIRRREAEADVRCLKAVPQGRLLDVGCGAGEWLSAMRERGWQVAGFDFDQEAVLAARKAGLSVSCGSLEEQTYPDNSFDAVTLSHVIEHLPDPVGTLKECARVLKPGGKLVLFTPNHTSLGHQIFRRNWRGLEPPRHLHLFSMQSMARILAMAGFREVSVKPFIVTSVVYDSLMLSWGLTNNSKGGSRHWSAWILTRLLKLAELCIIPWAPSVADCVIGIGVKPKTDGKSV